MLFYFPGSGVMGEEALGSLASSPASPFATHTDSCLTQASQDPGGRQVSQGFWMERGRGGRYGQLGVKSPAPLGIQGSEGGKQGSLWASPAPLLPAGQERREASTLHFDPDEESRIPDDEFSGSAPRSPSSPPGGLGWVAGCGGDCQSPSCLH